MLMMMRIEEEEKTEQETHYIKVLLSYINPSAYKENQDRNEKKIATDDESFKRLLAEKLSSADIESIMSKK